MILTIKTMVTIITKIIMLIDIIVIMMAITITMTVMLVTIINSNNNLVFLVIKAPICFHRTFWTIPSIGYYIRKPFVYD